MTTTYDSDSRPSPTAKAREYDYGTCDLCNTPLCANPDSEWCDSCEDEVRVAHGLPTIFEGWTP